MLLLLRCFFKQKTAYELRMSDWSSDVCSSDLPIGPIVLATNANRPLSRWSAEGIYQPGPSVATLANAMDVGAPSNFERLVHLPTHCRDVEVERVEDRKSVV